MDTVLINVRIKSEDKIFSGLTSFSKFFLIFGHISPLIGAGYKKITSILHSHGIVAIFHGENCTLKNSGPPGCCYRNKKSFAFRIIHPFTFFLQESLAVPESLGPVNECFGLGGNPIEKNGRRDNDLIDAYDLFI